MQLEILLWDIGKSVSGRDIDVSACVGRRVVRAVQTERAQVCRAYEAVRGLYIERAERCARREIQSLAQRAPHVLEKPRVDRATRGHELDVVVQHRAVERGGKPDGL